MGKKNMFPHYSVLMSVYRPEYPARLRSSVESMFAQSVPPSQFVLVIDGPVKKELSDEIERLCARYDITCVPIERNVGLAAALNAGLAHCKNDIIARMDSDDIAFSDRIENELVLMQRENADIVSGTVCEFDGETSNITSCRRVPETHDEIMKYARRRNPFNHPAVIYKRSVVCKDGGYGDYELFEDYEFFLRALKGGAKGANVSNPILYMRAGEGMYKRRGGAAYVKKMLRFYKRMSQLGACGLKERITCVFPRVAVALMPNIIRKFIYEKFLRG